jgi:tRNA G18 (ribose-2'-O)-methylase SpoU
VPAAPSKLYPTPAEKELTKTALGAETDIPFEQSEATACIEKLKSEGYTVIGLEQSASAVHYQTPLTTNKVALLIGTEVTGIPEELQKQCDVLYEIPMYGGKNSLNVAVATGVMLYSLRSNLQKTV